jgi:hypothetical protein
MLIEQPGFYDVHDGNIIGSNFLDERPTVVGVWDRQANFVLPFVFAKSRK